MYVCLSRCVCVCVCVHTCMLNVRYVSVRENGYTISSAAPGVKEFGHRYMHMRRDRTERRMNKPDAWCCGLRCGIAPGATGNTDIITPADGKGDTLRKLTRM